VEHIAEPSDFPRLQSPAFGNSTETLREELAALGPKADAGWPEWLLKALPSKADEKLGQRLTTPESTGGYNLPCSTEALREELEGQMHGMPYAAPRAMPSQMTCRDWLRCGAEPPLQAKTSSELPGAFRFTFALPKSKLLSRETRVVSNAFDIQNVQFKILVTARHLNNRRGGHCFKTAKGLSVLELKCEGTLPSHFSSLAFSFRVGNEAKASNRFVHDFSQASVGPPQGKEEWDLLSGVDPSTASCAIHLEAWPV